MKISRRSVPGLVVEVRSKFLFRAKFLEKFAQRLPIDFYVTHLCGQITEGYRRPKSYRAPSKLDRSAMFYPRGAQAR